MNILIITQKMDKTDAILGFFHRWVEEFAKNYERVTVICLYKGACALPDNVKVISLGKENGVSRLKYLARLYYYAFHYRKDYDHVFVHMNQIYVLLLGCLWRLWSKRIGLWYVHKQKTFSLWLAQRFAHLIFSVNTNTFPYGNSKIVYTGHGIDTDFFTLRQIVLTTGDVITVGRISRVKNIDALIRLVAGTANINLKIIGSTITPDDESHMRELVKLCQELHIEDRIKFAGPLTGGALIMEYHNAIGFISLSQTGGIDKAVLEALACGLPTITTNPAFNCHGLEKVFYSSHEKSAMIFEALMKNKSNASELRQLVVREHSIVSLIPKIKNAYIVF